MYHNIILIFNSYFLKTFEIISIKLYNSSSKGVIKNMSEKTQKFIIIFFAISFTCLLGYLFYSLDKDRQESYEKGMKEAQQLSTLNAMEQLRMAVKLYVLQENTYPETLIEELVNGLYLTEESISLKNKFLIDRNNLNIVYNQDFDCDFMFNNLNDHIHLKVENNLLDCKNKTLTFSIKGFKS